MAEAEQVYEALQSLEECAKVVANAEPGSHALHAAISRGHSALTQVKAAHREHVRSVETAKASCDQPQRAASSAVHERDGVRAYERAWYIRQMEACKSFTPSHSLDDAGVCSLSEVLASSDEATAASLQQLNERSHDGVMARLRHELSCRQSLEQRTEHLKKRKREESERKLENKRYVERMKPRIESVKQSIKQLAEQLHVAHYPSLQQRRLATLLPDPLYTAYCQLSHLESTFFKPMRTTIVGSEDEAREFVIPSTRTKQGAQQHEDEHPHHTNAEQEGRDGNAEHEDVYHQHPLSLKLEILANAADAKPLVSLSLTYLPRLHLVVADADGDDLGILLVDLCSEGDKGAGSPYPGTALNRPEFVFSLQRKARPYVWAQQLCGLMYLPMQRTPQHSAPGLSIENGVRHAHGASVVKALFDRVRAHKQLRRIIEGLKQREMPSVYSRSYGGKRVTIASFEDVLPSSGSANSWPLSGKQANAIMSAMQADTESKNASDERSGHLYEDAPEGEEEMIDYEAEDDSGTADHKKSPRTAVQQLIADVGTRRYAMVLQCDSTRGGPVKQTVHIKVEARYPEVPPKFTVSLRESNGLGNKDKMSMQKAANEEAVQDVHASSAEGAIRSMLEHQVARVAAMFEQLLQRGK